MPNHIIIIAGRFWILSIDIELLDTSCMREFVSINPPKIIPIERNAILHPNELKNFFPDLIWEEIRIKVDTDRIKLL